MKPTNTTSGETGKVLLYSEKGKGVRLEVQLEKETVWLTQKQMAKLFVKDLKTINEHIINLYQEGELGEAATIRNFRIVQSEAGRSVAREIKHYNLDVIISVGYRVKSVNGTRFRIWATDLLKKHLVDGYTMNQKLLKAKEDKFLAFQRAIKLIETVKTRKPLEYKEAMGLLDVIRDYSRALGLLDDYDNNRVAVKGVSRGSGFRLTYELALKAVVQLQPGAGGSALFGREKDKSFASSVGAIYQTFSGRELYASAEEKPLTCYISSLRTIPSLTATNVLLPPCFSGSWRKTGCFTARTVPSALRITLWWP